MSFEWHQDEDEGWEKQIPLLVVMERPPPPYRLYLVISIIILLIGGLAYWQLSRRVQATAAYLEAQLFTSLKLLQQAASSQDSELFNTLLSVRDGGWASAQQAMLHDEQLWGRRRLGLRWQAAANYTTTIQLAPDLTQAEALLQQSYTVQRVQGVTETVVLSQTAVFRPGQERWLLSAPDRDFWGETQTIETEHLAVIFPARDRPTIRRLLPALEAIIEVACQEVTSTACSSVVQIPVLFDTRPQSLYELNYPAEYPELGQVILPTPTLLGLPGSEVGVQLLAQSYAAYIVSSALPTISDWQGERPIIYQTTVEKQLNQWGLQEPALTSDNYESLVNAPVTLQEISLLWPTDAFHSLELRNHARALVEFLVGRGATAVDLQNSISNPNFWQWANLSANDPAVEQAWLQFLYDHSPFASQPPPLPLPELDIRLVCAGDNLYRYDWSAGFWQDEMQSHHSDNCGEVTCALQDLPGWPVWSPDGRSTLIMQENLSNLLVPQETQLWRGDGDGQIIAEIGTGYAPFWLDGQTYGYVRVGANGHGEIVTAAVNDDAPQLLLTIEGLFGRLPGPDSPLPAFIANVQVNPANPGTLLITILRENDTILVHIERGDRRVLIVNDASVFTAFSPNGRMIILDKPLDQTGRRVLTLTHNLTEFGQQIVPTNGNSINYDWTADSRWLLISYPGFLKLVTPGRNYFQLVPHEFGTCERVEWVQ
jgi:hypothetical protein